MPELKVEVVFAEAEQQSLLELAVSSAATVADVIRESALQSRYPQYEFDNLNVGIWGRPVSHDAAVKAGDRIEIYRPLELDPREARRQLALLGKTMSDAPPS